MRVGFVATIHDESERRYPMLQNLKHIEGRALKALDGTLGEVKDFYFDDAHWHIRYLVVETGAWLNSRRVLISPDALRPMQSDPDVFAVDLTMEQVRNSPEVHANNPVAHEQETALRTYYGWPAYWDTFANAAAPIIAATVNTLGPGYIPINPPVASTSDPHLRSANQMIGCHIEATDGSIGHVEDCLIDEKGWRMRYLLIDTGRWSSGRKVIVAPSWIRDVSWEKRTVTLGLTRNQIKASPLYEASASWNKEYFERLHDYYGLPRHADWDEDASEGGPKTQGKL
jgi:uncharacterized protein YrrD